MHPSNIHQSPHDFQHLAKAFPALRPFLKTTGSGKLVMDFSDANGIRCFNEALLATGYDITHWHFPPGNLCPPVPGRADYLLHMNDLLQNQPVKPHGEKRTFFSLLDIGTGASGIFPLLAARLFGWKCVGVDINVASLNALNKNLAHQQALATLISTRRQPDPAHFFHNIIQPGEYYAAVVCNPPFYTSSQVAENAWRKRWPEAKPPFGGVENELWSEGGEVPFIKRMIRESREFHTQVGWFSCLVSRAGNVRQLRDCCQQTKATGFLTVPMSQGNKISRFIAWRYGD